jgi:hypothetical protein
MNRKKIIRFFLFLSSLVFLVFLWMDQSEKQQLKIQSLPLTENLFQEFQNDFLQGFQCFSDPEAMFEDEKQKDHFLISGFKKNGSCPFLSENEKQKISKFRIVLQMKKIAQQKYVQSTLSYLYQGKARIQDERIYQSNEINASSFAILGLAAEGRDFQWNKNQVLFKIYGDTYIGSESLSSVTLKSFLSADEDAVFFGKASQMKVVDYESLGNISDSLRGKKIFLGSKIPVPTASKFLSWMDQLSRWSLTSMPVWQQKPGFQTEQLPQSLKETCWLQESMIPHWLLLNQPQSELSLDLREGTNDALVCGTLIAPKITLNIHGRVTLIGQVITENLTLIGHGQLTIVHPDRWSSYQSSSDFSKEMYPQDSHISQNWQGFLRSYGRLLRLPFDSQGWKLPAKEFWEGKYDFQTSAWTFQENDFLNFWTQLKEVK